MDISPKAPPPIKGGPLKCRVCPDVLILGALQLRQHVASKKHANRVEKTKKAIKLAITKGNGSEEDEGEEEESDEDKDEMDDHLMVICHAKDYKKLTESKEEMETHQERLQRVQRLVKELAEKNVEAAKKKKEKKKDREKKKKESGSGGGEKKKERAKRPGKRQRLALKVQREGDGGSGGKEEGVTEKKNF